MKAGYSASNAAQSISTTLITTVPDFSKDLAFKIEKCLRTGDLDQNGDVDGSDLAAYISNSMGIDLEDFAADFGRTNCP